MGIIGIVMTPGARIQPPVVVRQHVVITSRLATMDDRHYRLRIRCVSYQ